MKKTFPPKPQNRVVVRWGPFFWPKNRLMMWFSARDWAGCPWAEETELALLCPAKGIISKDVGRAWGSAQRTCFFCLWTFGKFCNPQESPGLEKNPQQSFLLGKTPRVLGFIFLKTWWFDGFLSIRWSPTSVQRKDAGKRESKPWSETSENNLFNMPFRPQTL